MTVGLRVRAAALVLGLASVMAACAPEAVSPPPDPAAHATVGPLALDDVRPLRPSAYDVRSREPLVVDDWSTTVLALDERGDALLATRRQDPRDPLALGAGRLSIRKAGSSEPVSVPAQRRPEPQQVTGGAMNDRWVVWQEDPGTELSISPWTMYAYDRVAGTTTKLVEAPTIDGRDAPAVPGHTGPTLSGDRVFWVQTEGHVDAETANVYGCTITACTPERYATAAAYPVAVDDHLYVIARDPAAKPRDPWERFTIEKIAIESRQAAVVEAVELEPRQAPAGLAASGRALAWIVNGRPDVITIRDLETGKTTVVRCELEGVDPDFGGGFGYPVATDRFVAWGESAGNSPANVGNYLYLLEEQALHSLGNASGLYGVAAAGDYLSWRDLADPARDDDVVVSVARLR